MPTPNLSNIPDFDLLQDDIFLQDFHPLLLPELVLHLKDQRLLMIRPIQNVQIQGTLKNFDKTFQMESLIFVFPKFN